MKLNFADGLKGWLNGADMAQAWVFGTSPFIVFPAGSAAEVRSGTSSAAGIMTRAIEPSARVAVSTDCRLPASNGALSIGASPAGYGDRNRTSSGSYAFGIHLFINNLVPRLYYDILTSSTGTGANSMLLDEMEPLIAGASYHIEMIIDHTEPVGVTKVYINGDLKSVVTYDRDRIASGFQATAFGEISFKTFAAATSNYPTLSNIVSYEPDPDPTPIGPIDVSYLVTPDPSLSIGPAVDTTGIAISDNAWHDLVMSDLGAGGDILAAELIYRVAAVAGQDPARAEVAIESIGVQRGSTDSLIITPGFAPKLLSIPLPATALAAPIINDVKMKIRSIAGGASA